MLRAPNQTVMRLVPMNAERFHVRMEATARSGSRSPR